MEGGGGGAGEGLLRSAHLQPPDTVRLSLHCSLHAMGNPPHRCCHAYRVSHVSVDGLKV